jgi:outer membrane protein TolC
MAVQASMRALAHQEVIAIQQRYEAGIATLSALLQSHAQLEKGKALSIANVERVLARLDASLAAPAPPPPPPPPGQ